MELQNSSFFSFSVFRPTLAQLAFGSSDKRERERERDSHGKHLLDEKGVTIWRTNLLGRAGPEPELISGPKQDSLSELKKARFGLCGIVAT